MNTWKVKGDMKGKKMTVGKHLTLMEAAKQYLSLGFSIVPIGKDKKSAVEWKEYQSRKPTLDEVEFWFTKIHNVTGVAIITGKISGLIVLDFEKEAIIPELPDTVVSNTGGGGKHFYFKYPIGIELPNITKLNNQPIDVRSNGGYVLAPPSLHPTGTYYKWEKSFGDISLAEFPEHWIGMIQDKAGHQNNNDFTQIISGVAEGGRNEAATKLLGKLLHGLPNQKEWPTVVWPLVQAWNLTNKPPLELKELQSIFNSIARRESEVNKGIKISLGSPAHISELLAEPDEQISWIVDGLIPVESITFLSGHPKSFKTWIFLHIAARVAAGQKVFGWYATTKSNVLVIDEEDAKSIIKPRLRKLSVAGQNNIYFWIQCGFKIDKPEHLQQLIEFIKRNNIKLVCMDSFRRVQLRDENDAKQVAEVFENLREISKLGVALFVSHHHRKQNILNSDTAGQSMRGSSDIFASLDGLLVVDRNPHTNTLTIEQAKLRVAPEQKPFKVKIIEESTGTIRLEFDGDAQTIETKKQEAKPLIVKLLAGGEKGRQEIEKALAKQKLGGNAIHDALKELEQEKLIQVQVGHRNKKVYSLPSKQVT